MEDCNALQEMENKMISFEDSGHPLKYVILQISGTWSRLFLEGGEVPPRACRDATEGKKSAGGDRGLAAMADDVAD